MERKEFWLLSAMIVLLAFTLRDIYVAQTIVLAPFSGDAGQYILYSHSIREGYFGLDGTPDAYRPPGYPALIALTQLLGGDGYQRLLMWQVLLGTATVAFTIALARAWLPPSAAALAGFLMAIWPHHIAFSAEVLTEVLAGFLLTAAMWDAAVAKGRWWAWAGAGLLFAAGAMVNSVIALVPLIAGVALLGRSAPGRWLALLTPVVLVVGGWSMRPVEGGKDRIMQNLVQGASPLYHESWALQGSDPAMLATARAIADETHAATANPAQGLRTIASRLAERPFYYAAWYASKPWHLWSWEVRISADPGIAVHQVKQTLFMADFMRSIGGITRTINPLLFVLALCFAACASLRPGAGRMIGLALLYLTAVHVVLQAEPRYSVPYRPIQMVLSVAALWWVFSPTRWRRMAGTTVQP
jgi:hypothetical protein